MADNKLLARLARQHGGRLLDAAIDKLLPADAAAADKAATKGKPGKGLTEGIAGVVMTRVALRSVPGAILVGGGILAKRLHDRRKARKLAEGRAAREAAHDTDLLSPESGE